MKSLSTRRSALAGLVRDCGASAVVEYAVCLALIVGGVIGIAVLVARPMQETFSASANLQRSAARRNPALAEAPVQAASIPVEDGMPPVERAMVAGCGVAMTAGLAAIAIWLLKRGRSRKLDDDLQPEQQALPKELQAKFVEKRDAILAILGADADQLFNGHATVGQIMSRKTLTQPPEMAAAALAKMMRENTIRHVVICSPAGAVLGIVSDRDLTARHGETAGDIMTAKPLTVAEDTPIGTVITIMLARRINCLPVVQEGRLCGIVTTSDMLMSLQCILRLAERTGGNLKQTTAGRSISAVSA